MVIARLWQNAGKGQASGAHAVTDSAARSWLLANLRDIHCEHQHLFALVHRYYSALSGGGDALANILDEIVEATAIHFASEEELLQALSHPGLKAHKAAHQPILDDLAACRGLVSGDTRGARVRTAHAMDALLIHHVRDDADIQRLSEDTVLNG
jgi:hemerythrin-like metal-binding protein